MVSIENVLRDLPRGIPLSDRKCKKKKKKKKDNSQMNKKKVLEFSTGCWFVGYGKLCLSVFLSPILTYFEREGH